MASATTVWTTKHNSNANYNSCYSNDADKTTKANKYHRIKLQTTLSKITECKKTTNNAALDV